MFAPAQNRKEETGSEIKTFAPHPPLFLFLPLLKISKVNPGHIAGYFIFTQMHSEPFQVPSRILLVLIVMHLVGPIL